MLSVPCAVVGLHAHQFESPAIRPADIKRAIRDAQVVIVGTSNVPEPQHRMPQPCRVTGTRRFSIIPEKILKGDIKEKQLPIGFPDCGLPVLPFSGQDWIISASKTHWGGNAPTFWFGSVLMPATKKNVNVAESLIWRVREIPKLLENHGYVFLGEPLEDIEARSPTWAPCKEEYEASSKVRIDEVFKGPVKPGIATLAFNFCFPYNLPKPGQRWVIFADSTNQDITVSDWLPASAEALTVLHKHTHSAAKGKQSLVR